MSLKKHLPNFLTCLNLLCGCLAVIAAFQEDVNPFDSNPTPLGLHPAGLIWASFFVGIAAVLDFLDGMAARVLNAYSELGKQLDSLADMVSFGVVPGIIMFHLIRSHVPETGFISVGLVALIIPVFSALRLAKFNIDKRQTGSFTGLPTPANAILICSLPIVFAYDELNIGYYLNNPYFLTGLTIVTSFLLVARIPMFSLKFKDFGWMNNKIRYVFLVIAVILLIIIHVTAIPVIILLYIILSILNNSIN